MDNSEIFSTDAFMESLGGCGRFQIFLMFLYNLTSFPALFSFLVMTFGMYNPGWRCMDNVTSTSGSGSWLNRSNDTEMARFIPEDNQTVPDYVKTCEGFDTCQKVEFNPEAVTIVTEWGLTCNRGWILSTVLSMKMVGSLLSTIVAGYVGDKYGRKLPYLVSRVFLTLINLISIYSVSWQMYAVTLFLLGFNGSLGILAMVNLAEYVTPKWRVRINSIPSWSIIAITFSVTAMLTKNWKTLRLVVVVSGVISIIAVALIPESIRWLSVQGKRDAVLKLSKRVARVNRAPEPTRDQVDSLIEKNREGEKKKSKTYSMLSLFRKGYRLNTLIVAIIFFALDSAWYAFGFGIAALPGNMYTNLIVFFVSDMPPCLIAFSIANLYRRKPVLISCFCSYAVTLFGVVAMDLLATGGVKRFGVLVMVLMAKLFLYVGWIVLLTAVIELYPTIVRSTVISFVMLSSNLGGVVSPYLIPTDPSSFYICYSVLAVLGLICASFSLLIPETKGKPLKDNWEDCRSHQNGDIVVELENT